MNQSYEALRRGAAWVDLVGRGKIRAYGEDRVRLVHAMCTNHVEQLREGQGCYAFFLTAQGRILADAHILALPDHLLLDTNPETKQRLYEHLDKYIIADDVTLEDGTANTATVGVEGPKAREILKELNLATPEQPYSFELCGSWIVLRASAAGADGFMIFVPAAQLAELVSRLECAGMVKAQPEDVNVVRLENAYARYGVDFSDANIPQETQLMHALHFAKGCYLGQEIVERVRSRGHVNRLLVPLDIEAETAPVPGTKILAGDKEAGQVTSAAYSPARGKVAGFGILRAESLNATLTADGAVIRVRPGAAPARP